MDDVAPYALSGSPFAPKPLYAALALAFGLGAAPSALAATFTVTNLADSGAGSLRAAIVSANGAAGADTIVFGAGVTGTITLTSGEIAITDDLTITGPGAASLTITKSGAAGRLLDITGATTNVTISGLRFTGGDSAAAGGAIAKSSAGTLIIQSSVFSNNQTTGVFAGGGALYNSAGNVTIQNSTFTGNTGAGGGAFYQSYTAGSVLIQNSTFSGNTARRAGGALYATSGSLTIQSSTFSGNSSARNGGALYTRGVVIQNSTFSGNSSAADAGAIYLYEGSTGSISNSTITGNTATAGEGGALLFYNATLTITSTILAGNSDRTGPNNIFDLGGSTINASNSLIDNVTGFTFTTNTANILNQNPLLGGLANNGGPTQTHALLPGSPAINKGSNPLALSFDQRGTGFARTAGVQTDIGAFEVQSAAPPPPPPGSGQVANIPTLSQWGLVLLNAMLAGWAIVAGFGRRRRPDDA